MEKWFTPEERGVILFLMFVLIVGICVYLYKIKAPAFAPELNVSTRFSTTTDIKKIISESREVRISASTRERKNVNINKAGAEELMSLSGIGPVYAERIVEYRERHGSFKVSGDIMKVKGIGEKRYDKLKDRIVVQDTE